MATKKPARKNTPTDVEAAILVKSARRCALCFHLNGDLTEKLGQIAHLDRDRSNPAEDNLAYMCLAHHSLFDSITSQHKNYTVAELKAARSRLYDHVASTKHLEPTVAQSDHRSEAERLIRRNFGGRTAIVEDLNPREIELLWTAVQAEDLLHDTTLDGEALRAGGRQFLEGADARTAAEWLGALRDLEGRGFIEPLSGDRDFFRVTDRGYKAADNLQCFARWNTHTVVLKAYDFKVPAREAVLSCTGVVAIPAAYYPDQTGMDGGVARSLKERRYLLIEGTNKEAVPPWQPTDVEFKDESTGVTEEFHVEGLEVIRSARLKLPIVES